MADKPKPLCRRCQKNHFNFVPCAAVETFDADRAEKSRRLQNMAQPVLRPRGNDWGNRYLSGDYIEIAPGVAVLKRPPLHSVRRGA